MAISPAVAVRICHFIRLLSSDRDGEVVAAARAIIRTLKGAGADIHVLAERIEHPSFTETEMLKLYDAGYDAGLRAAESDPIFRNVNLDGEPSWHDIACECAAHPHRMLSEREKQFVADMVRRTVHGGQPTPKQTNWLRKIYARVRR
jgi:hypothetical protein